MNVYDTLSEIMGLLKSVGGVKTLKIGLEANLSPSDYPIIRVVANDNELSGDDGWAEDVYFSIYCGAKLDEKIGIDEIYKFIYGLENSIKFTLHNEQLKKGGLIRFISTKSDDDTLKNFKILCLRFVIKSVRLMED